MTDSIFSRGVKETGSAVSKRAYHAPEAISIPVGATAGGQPDTVIDGRFPTGNELGPGWSGS